MAKQQEVRCCSEISCVKRRYGFIKNTNNGTECYDKRVGIENSKVTGKGYNKWRNHSKTQWKSFLVGS